MASSSEGTSAESSGAPRSASDSPPSANPKPRKPGRSSSSPRASAASFDRPPVAFLQHVVKTYGEGAARVEALKGIDLRVDPGEFVAIMGPSGSGKSTLLHILGCMDVPTSGVVKIDGVSVPRQSDSERTRLRSERIGFVFQSFHLLRDLTVRENIELPQVYLRNKGGKSLPRAEELIRRVKLPRALLDRHPTQVSGGEAQRVAIARALSNEPSLLLGDEPTGNLDTANSETVMGVFESLWKEGATIVLVTHNPEVAARAQRIVRMADGAIASEERKPAQPRGAP